MGQIPIETYFAELRKLDPKYHWPMERDKDKESKREKTHAEFPHVVTFSGHYGHGMLLDEMQDWCREHLSDRHGECHWHYCEFSFDKWYDDNNIDQELDDEIEKQIGPRPERKRKRAWEKWFKKSNPITNKFFDELCLRLDSPDDHSHIGVWTSLFICKTGYDYGYEDFCFKNLEDAFYFKLMWAEEAEKRG